MLRHLPILLALLLLKGAPAGESAPPQVNGVYPHLAMFNNEGECGTGAVVPWAGKLWVITYGPHLPKGSSDKLYEISPDLQQTVRPESIGGTPANRMIHRESQQLFIGPYAIDAQGAVRAIPYSAMFGRHTGNARHLTDPANKIYYATMEEGFYEVDVKTLEAKELYKDGNATKNLGGDLLPGYHGKGLYSSQGRLIYANNGERSNLALTKPDIPSGCLAEWDGKEWKVVRRNQFTEVTGPGGIEGNTNPNDPVWSIGWDHRSLLLMLRDNGAWHAYRLPKASHTYDGAHGWNTEWPRIRDIGENDLLMTMHGTFWRFPKTFGAANSKGIAPRSTYLKVIGDFARWNDRLVLGCDDTAKSEFLNKRKEKGALAGPGQSQSNLWFVKPETLDQLGGPLGRGAVWVNDPVQANETSDPFLFTGFEHRALHLSHDAATPVTFTLEIDSDGTNNWRTLRDVQIPAKGTVWTAFTPEERGVWIRVKSSSAIENTTAFFSYASPRTPPAAAAEIFNGLATPASTQFTGGLLLTRGENKRTLSLLASSVSAVKVEETGAYELDAALNLKRLDDPKLSEWVKKSAAIPVGVIQADAASVIVTAQDKRYRLPKGSAAFDATPALPLRIDREVCTERDLFNAYGIFYELPAENAGGFAKIRPVCTHNRQITDYCSYRGLMIFTGVDSNAPANARIIKSDDGKAAVWAGVVDELWSFGKATGIGGPWKDSAVEPNVPSDPYLMSGYDKKTLTLSHAAGVAVNVRVEVDITGNGDWKPYQSFSVPPKEELKHVFPAAFNAYWVRAIADQACSATAWFVYE